MLKDNTYITITRQYGSGGKEVANIVAKKLGINCYDRKIVHLAAERFHNSTEPISNEVMEDLITTSYSMPGSLGDYSFESIPFYNKMFKEQSIAILKLAQKGSAVFLGRCSDYILKDYPNTFSFFIYADDDFRQNRAKDHYGNNTLEQLDKEDKNRKRYYAYYTGHCLRCYPLDNRQVSHHKSVPWQCKVAFVGYLQLSDRCSLFYLLFLHRILCY